MTAIAAPTALTTMSDWVDQLVLDLDLESGGVVIRPEYTDWRDWAMDVVAALPKDGGIPMPYDFADWRSWAERFVQAMA